MAGLIQDMEKLIAFYTDISQKISKVDWTAEDEQRLKRHASDKSNFDTDNFKAETCTNKSGRWHYKLNNSHLLVCGKQAPSNNLLEAMALALMIMGPQPYTIYWFMNPTKRLFPPRNQPVGPKHINGGYCYSCQPDTIVIYRMEDALRVLIHELQHASCLDKKTSLAQLEAETEAWAELIYAMIGAYYHRIRPAEAWAKQVAWSQAQNERLVAHHKVHSSADYAWRYTVGKVAVWRRFGLIVPQPGKGGTKSLQLGCPELDIR